MTLDQKQLTAEIARVMDLDAKRHDPGAVLFHLTSDGYGENYAQLCTKEERVPSPVPDGYAEAWQACVDYYASAPLMADIIRQQRNMIDVANTRIVELEAAARDLLEATIKDCGDPDDHPEDDGAVGSGDDGDMLITFAMIRRLREVLK